MLRSERTRNLLSAAVFILLATAIIWIAIPYGVQEPKKVKFVALSPSYYPRLVSYCLLALGCLILIRSLLPKPLNPTNQQESTSRYQLLVPIVFILFLLYWFLEYLGFVLGPILALLAMLLLAGERNIVAILIISVTLPLCLYLFFTQVANIPIPGGILDPLLLKLQ